MTAAPHWKRSQLAVVVSTFTFFAGANFLIPFLPLYVQELDQLNFRETALWSGAILAAAPLVAGIASPFWGVLADRWGTKLILLRALVGFSLTLGLLGIATTAWQLLVIRLLTGLFVGYSGTAATFISANNPKDQLTSGIGKIHSARILGLAAGPLPGGILADTIGYRSTCFVSMSIGLATFLLVLFMVREDHRPISQHQQAERESVRTVLGNSALLSSVFIVLVIRLTERSFEPVLPLLIAHQGVDGIGVATATALITSAGQFVTAATSGTIGRFVTDANRDRVLRLSLFASAVILLPILLTSTWVQLLAIRVLIGAVLGIAITLIYSATATEAPVGRRGLTLSVLATGMSFGGAAGFLLAGALSVISLTLVFVVDAIAVIVAAVAHRLARRRGP